MSDEKFDKIVDELSNIKENISEIKTILARHEVLHERNTDSIEYHIKRTELAEKRIEMLQENDLSIKEQITVELAPIKAHISVLKGVGLALSILGAIIMGLHQLGVLDKLL